MISKEFLAKAQPEITPKEQPREQTGLNKFELKNLTASAPAEGESPVSDTDLIDACVEMRNALVQFRQLASRAEVIAISAAIEGARLRSKLPDFSVVAEEMQGHSLRNLDLSERLEILIEKLQTVALRSTAVRYYELAEDLIDKIDRNLFERNCDCQAWATFEAIVACAQKSQKMDASAIREVFEADPVFQTASLLLEKLTTTYVVYSDIFLLNASGIVINAAMNKHCIGESWKTKSWYREAVQGKVHVSDMQYSEAVGGYSIYYSAPVTDENGKVLGVLSTRFNWAYAQEMIASAGYDSDIQAYYLNSKGEVIASTNEIGTLKDHMHWLDSGRDAMNGNCGHAIEQARNGIKIAVGYARTRGYNSYRGKKWSALLTKRLREAQLKFLHEIVDRRTEAEPAGSRYLTKEQPIESEQANGELIATMADIVKLIEQVTSDNRQVGFLAINASIQAGRAGIEGDSFSIIAVDIGRLAKSSLDFVNTIQKATRDLNQSVLATVANRLKDAARDAADKVDRNLFERYCDVQAWTTFDQFIASASQSRPSVETNTLLAKLHKIYEVYHDIILLDREGTIVGAGVNQNLIGQNQGDRSWFREAINGKVNFTDVYNSNSIRKPTVAYSAPILNNQGDVIGVLSTRFNCNFLNDIIKAVIAPIKSSVYLVNSQGLVIAAANEREVMTKSFSHLQSFKALQKQKSGTISETDSQDKIEYSTGFSRAEGYNTYPGKKWSVLIRLPSQG